MIINTRIKKISVWFTILGFVIFMSSNNVVLAKENIKKVKIHHITNAKNLLDNYDKNSQLCRKLRLDYNESVTKLSEEKEKELNAIGVFDSDINAMDDKTINKINQAYKCSISVMYFKEDNEKIKKMTEDETDELIEELYKKDLDKESILDKLIDKTIFGVTKVNAKSKMDTKTSNTCDTGRMKQILACIQSKKNGPIEVTFTASWIKQPKTRRKDVVGVTLKNATPEPDTWSSYYKCEYRTGLNANSPYYIDKKKLKCQAENHDGMYTSFSFFPARLVFVREEWVTITFKCTKDIKKMDYISAQGIYKHSETNVSYSLSLALDTSGNLSIGVSGSKKVNFVNVNPNAFVKFYTK